MAAPVVTRAARTRHHCLLLGQLSYAIAGTASCSLDCTIILRIRIGDKLVVTALAQKQAIVCSNALESMLNSQSRLYYINLWNGYSKCVKTEYSANPPGQTISLELIFGGYTSAVEC